jgi:hypothetical protein
MVISFFDFEFHMPLLITQDTATQPRSPRSPFLGGLILKLVLMWFLLTVGCPTFVGCRYASKEEPNE